LREINLLIDTQRIILQMLIKNISFLVTMDGERRVVEGADLRIEENRIVEIGRSGQLKRIGDEEVIDASKKAVLPGLINTHTHAAMSLLRGLGEDLPLIEWLKNYIWPVEWKMVDRDFCYVGSMLSCLEMIKNGITTFADMYFHEDECARAAFESGMRVCVSTGIFDVGLEGKATPEAKSIQEAVEINERVYREWNGRGGRINVGFGPHSVYTCDLETLQKVKELTEKYKTHIQIHLAESKEEIKQVKEKYGRHPVEVLESIGFLGSNVVASHCVWLEREHMEILKRNNVKVAHAPVSNMKLASGVAPVVEMLNRGITVGLATDGAASNNDLDIFEEMKTAALLHKLNRQDPTALPATKILEMATIDGAKVLGMEREVGSIEVGKRADLIFIDLEKLHLAPLYNIFSHLVYAAESSDVCGVIIDGKRIFWDGKVLTVDEGKVLDDVKKRAEGIENRLGKG
jgi:5-methylthioadenosine/S-adenosylhomocysteine deaminase